MKTDQNECEWVLGQLEPDDGRLNDWEQGFVQNLKEQVEDGRCLSPKQEARLMALWSEIGDM